MDERSLKDLGDGLTLVRGVEEELRDLAGTLHDAGMGRPARRVALAINRLSKAARLIDSGTGGALAAHVAAGEQATVNMVMAALTGLSKVPDDAPPHP